MAAADCQQRVAGLFGVHHDDGGGSGRVEAVLSQIRTIVFHVSETETDGVCLRGMFVGVCEWMGVHMRGWVWLCSVKRRPSACDAAIQLLM